MAAQLSGDSRLFGLDLARWPAQWRAAGQLLFALPGLRALTPWVNVRMVEADGQVSHWRIRHGVAERLPQASDESASKIDVAQMSRDDVLERRLALPVLSVQDIDAAIALEVQANSPFGAENTIHGYASEAGAAGVTQVELAMTSRQQAQVVLERAGLTPAAEIWVLPAAASRSPVRPIVLRGWGEAARERTVAKGQRRVLGWLVLLAVLLAALAVTPTAFKRQQAIQAQRHLDGLQQQAGPRLAQREALVQGTEALRAIDEIARGHLSLPPVLDLLTRALPDGSWLTSVRVEGDKVVLNGLADDAAALVQRLASQPGVSSVRLASPATRGPGESKERFVIELYADAHRYGPVRAASAPAGDAS